MSFVVCRDWCVCCSVLMLERLCLLDMMTENLLAAALISRAVRMATGVVGVTWSRISSALLTDISLPARLTGCPCCCRLAADGASRIPCQAEMTHGYSYRKSLNTSPRPLLVQLSETLGLCSKPGFY